MELPPPRRPWWAMLINPSFYSSLPSREGLTHGRAQLQHKRLQNLTAGEEKQGGMAQCPPHPPCTTSATNRDRGRKGKEKTQADELDRVSTLPCRHWQTCHAAPTTVIAMPVYKSLSTKLCLPFHSCIPEVKNRRSRLSKSRC